MLEELNGYVEHIVFHNEENGYTVLDLDCGGESSMCVGCIGSVSEGEHLLIQAEQVINPTYGPQYQIRECQILPPEDIKSIERYLASGAIKGIGAAMAGRIIRRFGEDTFRIIEEEPERLAEIKGISMKKAQDIASCVAEKRDLRIVMMQIQQYGISYQLSMKLYQQYGMEITKIIRENPYQLAEEVQGIGFLIADEIAKKVGIGTDSDFRIRSGLLFVLQQASSNGHLYLPKLLLLQEAGRLLGIEEEIIEHHVMDLCIEKKIYLKKTKQEIRVYAAQNYYMEMNVARMLLDFNVKYPVDQEEILRKIQKLEKKDCIDLDKMQKQAVLEAARKGLLLITGGPGTGKTTTIQTMIHYFESEGMDFFLAAPTGRAAKRMTETTGYEAKTIHRLLELTGGLDGNTRLADFGRNEENPLEADVIIIDETSMLDIYLLNYLLKATVVGTRLIFVGDVNQLPSVGPGCVLKDMIECEILPVVCLTRIFRQAMESDIVKNAHKINRGEKVDLTNKKSRDFFFIAQNDTLIMQRAVLSLVQEKMPRYLQISPFDVQVLTPMRKGLFGVVELNKMLQKYLNPQTDQKREKEASDGVFREGDKVMQTKNNYQLEWEIVNRYHIAEERGMGVFNGDVGVIQSINPTLEKITVKFDDGRLADYPFKQLDELELAYAITVHKSQGSEYPAVVIPVFSGPRPLMNRNLLYTAVTRAKSCVTMVGNPQIFFDMEANESENKRYSGLKDFLMEMNDQS